MDFRYEHSEKTLCWQGNFFTPQGPLAQFSVLLNRFLHLCQKEKGVFQHSSFLAGGATIAAGTFSAENGVIKVFCCTNH
jgi:hypothetical protein